MFTEAEVKHSFATGIGSACYVGLGVRTIEPLSLLCILHHESLSEKSRPTLLVGLYYRPINVVKPHCLMRRTIHCWTRQKTLANAVTCGAYSRNMTNISPGRNPRMLERDKSFSYSSRLRVGHGSLFRTRDPTRPDSMWNNTKSLTCSNVLLNRKGWYYYWYLEEQNCALSGLSVFGVMQMVQCKWRNGENNRTLTLTLFLTLNVTLNDYFRHCAICIAPNTDSPLSAAFTQSRAAGLLAPRLCRQKVVIALQARSDFPTADFLDSWLLGTNNSGCARIRRPSSAVEYLDDNLHYRYYNYTLHDDRWQFIDTHIQRIQELWVWLSTYIIHTYIHTYIIVIKFKKLTSL